MEKKENELQSKKEKWVIDYIQKRADLHFVDMLDADFVNCYIEEFDVNFQFVGIGASKCPELSKLLGSMYKKGLLNRFPHGVRPGLCQDGRFPKWVYSYVIPK